MVAVRAWRCGNEIVHSLSLYRDATAPTSMLMRVYIISIYIILYGTWGEQTASALMIPSAAASVAARTDHSTLDLFLLTRYQR